MYILNKNVYIDESLIYFTGILCIKQYILSNCARFSYINSIRHTAIPYYSNRHTTSMGTISIPAFNFSDTFFLQQTVACVIVQTNLRGFPQRLVTTELRCGSGSVSFHNVEFLAPKWRDKWYAYVLSSIHQDISMEIQEIMVWSKALIAYRITMNSW